MSVNLRAREWSIEDLENSELSKKMDKKKKKVAIEFPHKKYMGCSSQERQMFFVQKRADQHENGFLDINTSEAQGKGPAGDNINL